MKQLNFLLMICLLNLSLLNAQTTFDWDTAASDNGNNVTETINGITTTFTGPNDDTEFFDVSGFGGSSGNIVSISNSGIGASTVTLVTFNFSEAVDVISILALEGNLNNIDYTFTPTGGNNSPVIASLTSGSASVTLNWSGITSFTVTSNGSWFAFDNLIVNNSTLSTNDFKFKTIKVFPNPSSDFIKINGLTTIEGYEIYNAIGQKVKKGIVLKNEKIDVKNLTSGIYFLKLQNKNSVKFIKE